MRNHAGIETFLFQSRYRAASHFRKLLGGNYCDISLFQSRYRAASHFRSRAFFTSSAEGVPVSISLSSGFSFQVNRASSIRLVIFTSFNLVIERLLISGITAETQPAAWVDVSISLSSGFSFQAGTAANVTSSFPVSISLSSGFSFQVRLELQSGAAAYPRFNLVIERLLISGESARKHRCRQTRFELFQSRYRAASHFRLKQCCLRQSI